MSEPTAAPATEQAAATTEPAAPATPTAPAEGTPAPPWGSDEEFNPQKAWDLIQNLRTESKDAKAKLREHEDAQLTEQQRAARDAEELRTTNADLATENALLTAILAHPELSKDDIELLRGVPADAIAERAAKLAARLGAGTPSKPLTTRPSEALRGGSNPTVAPTEGGTDWLRSALNRRAD